MSAEPDNFALDARAVMVEVLDMLVAKNKAYGNAALDPVRVFSKASPVEQLKVRIDDKLSRLAKGNDFADEDTVLDLLGYLVILRIAQGRGLAAHGVGMTIDEAFGSQQS